jgi:hypothetical protein
LTGRAKTWRAPLIAGALALVGASGAALADDVHCPPHLGPVTIDGNVLIVAACHLEGTRVKGNVHLYTGGSLIATDASINGNIQAENADFIDVLNSRVGGDIQLDNMVGDLSRVDRSRIGGNIQLKENRSRLEVLDNTVIGDVQAFSNSGGVVIVDNTIDGNLQCKSNDPAPAGGGNRVGGNREDQCANLQPESTSSTSGQSRAVAGGDVITGEGGGSLDLLTGLLMLLFAAALRSRWWGGRGGLR